MNLVKIDREKLEKFGCGDRLQINGKAMCGTTQRERSRLRPDQAKSKYIGTMYGLSVKYIALILSSQIMVGWHSGMEIHWLKNWAKKFPKGLPDCRIGRISENI